MAAVDQAIYVIIDGSGSMSSVKHDVVKGINDFITEQQDDIKGTQDVVLFSLTSFDTNVQEIYVRENLELVNPVSLKDTYLGGGTSLLDAIGRTLTKAEDEQADRNIVVIYTDGGENSSHEFTKTQVGDLIDKLTGTGDWQIIYLGAEFADFAEDRQGFGAIAGAAAGGTFTGMNTSKNDVGATFSNLSQTSIYYRGMHTNSAKNLVARGGVVAAAAEDIGLTWNEDDTTVIPADVVEPKKKA